MDPVALTVGILVPGLVFGLASLALARPFGDGASNQWASGLALLVAFVTGYWLVQGAPALPPGQSLEWLPYLGLLGLGVGFVTPAKPRVAACVAAAALVPWLLLANKHGRWGGGEAALWLGLSSAFLVSALLAWDRLAARLGTRWWALLAMNLAATLAIVLAYSGDLKLGRLAGVLAAGCGALVTVNWIWPRVDGAARFLPVFVVTGFGLLVIGHVDFYGFVPRVVSALVWLAPLAALVLPKSTKPWLVVVAVSLLLGLAVGLAIASAPPLDEYEEYR